MVSLKAQLDCCFHLKRTCCALNGIQRSYLLMMASRLARPFRLHSTVSTQISCIFSVNFLPQASRLCRNASTLVLADHNCESVNPVTYNTITAAKQLGGDITALVCGPDCSKVAGELSKAAGVGKLLVAQDNSYKGFLPEALSPLILAAQKQFGFTHILSGASAVGKVRVFVLQGSGAFEIPQPDL